VKRQINCSAFGRPPSIPHQLMILMHNNSCLRSCLLESLKSEARKKKLNNSAQTPVTNEFKIYLKVYIQLSDQDQDVILLNLDKLLWEDFLEAIKICSRGSKLISCVLKCHKLSTSPG